MTRDPLAPDTGSSSDGGSLIFISDASAEAERLTLALRARSYFVVDVPLGLLVSRVAVQRPSLVICDADALGALETVKRVREVGGGERVDVLFIGEPSTLQQSRNEIEREASGVFERPIDVDLLSRKVEALIGAPRPSRALSMPAAGRSPALVASTRRPYRFDGQASLRSNMTGEVPAPPPSSPSQVSSPAPSSPISSAPPAAPSSPPSPPSVLPGAGGGVAHARLSPDLEALLGRAEARVRNVQHSLPPTDRLSPEAELDAILPPDLLAALDEPLDLEEEDDGEDDEEGNTGTHGSEVGGRRAGHNTSATGAGSASGKGTNAGTAAGKETSAGSRPPQGAKADPSAPGREAPNAAALEEQEDEEAPVTPPAVRTRNPPPMPAAPEVPAMPHSLRTSLEPFEIPRDQTQAPSGPPPKPSDPPSLATGVGMDPLSQQVSTKPPRGERAVFDEPESPHSVQPSRLEIPAALGSGEAMGALARAVRARFSGAVVFEDSAGIRRVVFRDGDFVTAASGSEGESLLEFLVQRGDLAAELVAKLGRKLPQFGRHAGAALIASGHLRQDELWNVLRAHAEWIVARVMSSERSGASVEDNVPPRLAAEPGVFGGATGAEVLLEIIRRVLKPNDALARLGGAGIRLVAGPAEALLGECALPPQETEWVREAQSLTVGEALERAGNQDFAIVLYTLTELGVLRSASSAPRPRMSNKAPAESMPPDELDDAALRTRIKMRHNLVEEGDYFALLGLSREATSYDVKRAYGELKREFDLGRMLTPATVDMRDEIELVIEVLDEAYDVLSDQLRRERYRRALEAMPR